MEPITESSGFIYFHDDFKITHSYYSENHFIDFFPIQEHLKKVCHPPVRWQMEVFLGGISPVPKGHLSY